MNNCFNSIIFGKDKKSGKLSQKRSKNIREVRIKEWIYDDLKLLKRLNKKQLSDKITLLADTLEKKKRKLGSGKEDQETLRKTEAAIAHAKKIKSAFDEGRYSKESVIIWLDRFLMSDHSLCRDVYEGCQEQEERRSKNEKQADHEAYLDQISNDIERFINSSDGLEANFQEQKDPIEEEKKIREIEEILKNNPEYKPEDVVFQKVHFVGEKDQDAEKRHKEKSKDKLVVAQKETIREHLTVGDADFI